MQRYSQNFGKKERVLNYACQTYQLSRPNKVGAVMALIRDCQPSSFEEWESWYFDNAHTTGKFPTKITVEKIYCKRKPLLQSKNHGLRPYPLSSDGWAPSP